MKLGQNTDVDDPNVELEGQGHRSKSRSPGKKRNDFRSHLTVLHVIFVVKGHIDQGQRSRGSSSKVEL